MENIELLQQIGLTELEAKVYLTLLKSGELSTGDLAKKLNIQRSTIYYLFERLQEKGLIVESLKGKRRLFKANNPKILEQQAQEIHKKIKEAIPEMLMSSAEDESDEVLLFKGYKGIKAIYEEMLEDSKVGDEFLILGARGGEDVSIKTYRNFYKNFNNRRIKKKINQKIIMNLDLKKEIGDYYKNLALTEIKYLNQKTLAPIVVFPKAVAIVQWKEQPTLFLLKGNLIREFFKQYFEVMWKIAK